MPVKHLNRRSFLKGMGVALQLPLLDIMAPTKALASTSAATAPKRLIWCFQPNGFYPDTWNPKGEGKGCELPRVLQPFESYRDQMTIFRQLNNNAKQHAGNVTALLTGHQAEPDPETGRHRSAKSIDQTIADHIAGDTPMRSLEIGVDHPPTGYCASTSLPLSYGSTIAWRTPLQPLPVEVRPRAIFERILQSNTKLTPRERSFRKSVLDLVHEDAKAIQKIGSNSDRRRVDEFLESVRSIELRLERAEADDPRLWTPLTKPDEALLQPPPAGVPHSRPEHIKLLTDLLVLALWTDTTRVSTFMLGASQCNADFSFLNGVNQPFHEGCSHHGFQEAKISQYVTINEFHAQCAAEMLRRLDDIDEGDGSLLDHSLVFFGSSLKDGHVHASDDLPLTAIGGLHGRVPHSGNYFAPEDSHVGRLHATTLKWYGIDRAPDGLWQHKPLPGLG